MPNSTAIIDAFLAQGALLFRERPFGPLPSLDEPLDQLPIPTLIYLRWLASWDAFIDHSIGSTIAHSDSPLELATDLRATFHEAIPGHALREDALNFTVEYFSPQAIYLSDFSSIFPHAPRPSQDNAWVGENEMWTLLDARFASWKGGESSLQKPNPSDSEFQRNSEESTNVIAQMTPEAWISRLEMVSSAVQDHEGSVAYANHFYVPMVGNPTDDVVAAVFREFLRHPPHDRSLLCAAENFLGEVPFLQYAATYAITVSQLLDVAPRFALDLLDYPGCALKKRQIRQLLGEIRRKNPQRDVTHELGELAIEWNADGDEPFASVVAERR